MNSFSTIFAVVPTRLGQTISPVNNHSLICREQAGIIVQRLAVFLTVGALKHLRLLNVYGIKIYIMKNVKIMVMISHKYWCVY